MKKYIIVMPRAMRSFIVAFALFISGCILYPEIARAQSDYYTLPFHGRSNIMRTLLGRDPDRGFANVVFLVGPMVCPRCEGLLYEVMQRLESVRRGATFCVVSYPRMASARDYLIRRRFPVKAIIDTSGALFEEIGLGSAPPFVTIWDSTGTLLYAKALYGISTNDSALWDAIGRPPMPSLPTTAGQGTTVDGGITPEINAARHAPSVGLDAAPREWRSPIIERSVILEEGNKGGLGRVGYLALDSRSQRITVTDEMTLTVHLFDLKSGRRLRTFELDRTLRKQFSPAIDDKTFDLLERNSSANTMLFGSYFTGSHVVVTASLPEFLPHPEGGLTYNNVPTVLTFSAATGRLLSARRIGSLIASGLAVTHTSPVLLDPKRPWKIAFPVGKGYPFRGTSSSTAVGPDDPTAPDFYRHAPLFTTCDARTGKLGGFIGSLDSIAMRQGIGYAIAKPLLASNGDDYYIAQHLVPYVVSKRGNIIRLKSYFNRDIRDTGAPRTTLPTIDEINHLADSSGAFISHLDAGSDRLFVTWHVKLHSRSFAKDRLIMVQEYSLRTGLLRGEWSIARQSAGGTLVDMIVDPARSKALCIYQDGVATTAVVYRLR